MADFSKGLEAALKSVPRTWGEYYGKECCKCQFYMPMQQNVGTCFRYAPSPYMVRLREVTNEKTGQQSYQPDAMAMQFPQVPANLGCGEWQEIPLLRIPARQ